MEMEREEHIKVTFEMTEAEMHELADAALRAGVTLSGFVRSAVEEKIASGRMLFTAGEISGPHKASDTNWGGNFIPTQEDLAIREN